MSELTNAQMETLLMEGLRLYHHPIAVHFLRTEEDVKKYAADNEYTVAIKPMTFCQWEIAARMANQNVLAFAKDLGCSNAHVSFGWKEIDDAEIKSHSKYCVDLEQAARFVHSKPRVEMGFMKAIAVGPLGKAKTTPDVVHFYCDNMQSYHLAGDYASGNDEHPLRPAVTINSSACGGSVFCFKEDTFNMCPACSGSYNAGKTERGEVNVFIPGTKLQKMVQRMKSRMDANNGSASITRPGDAFPGSDICKNCPLIIFKKGSGDPCASCENK